MHLVLFLLLLISATALPQDATEVGIGTANVKIESQVLSEDVLKALQSQPDEYGIPRKLYLHDRELNRLKTNYRDATSKRKKTLKTSFTGGPIFVGVGILLWILEESDESTITYYNGVPSYGYAALGTIVGSGITIYGLIEYLKPAPSTDELLKHYNSKYSSINN